MQNSISDACLGSEYSCEIIIVVNNTVPLIIVCNVLTSSSFRQQQRLFSASKCSGSVCSIHINAHSDTSCVWKQYSHSKCDAKNKSTNKGKITLSFILRIGNIFLWYRKNCRGFHSRANCANCYVLLWMSLKYHTNMAFRSSHPELFLEEQSHTGFRLQITANTKFLWVRFHT